MTIECYAYHKSVVREHLKAELNRKPETLEGNLSDKTVIPEDQNLIPSTYVVVHNQLEHQFYGV